ncbi:MAG: hypothetical protein PHU85_15565 [Phycisphaerae bacterium]|nr:hypothetical protein [Phycisphaerae bacterium]
MPTSTVKEGALIAGYDVSWNASIDSNAETLWNPDITAGQSADDWTYGSASTGTADMPTGHGIESEDLVDVYWADGFRAGLTATVTDDSVALSGGTGDDLPADDTAVILCVQVAVNAAFDADALALIVASATARSILTLTDDEAGVHTFELLTTAGLLWHNQSATTNPLDGKTIVSATMSTTNTTAEKTVTFAIGFDSTDDYPA